jgi:hypothetical protein
MGLTPSASDEVVDGGQQVRMVSFRTSSGGRAAPSPRPATSGPKNWGQARPCPQAQTLRSNSGNAPSNSASPDSVNKANTTLRDMSALMRL